MIFLGIAFACFFTDWAVKHYFDAGKGKEKIAEKPVYAGGKVGLEMHHNSGFAMNRLSDHRKVVLGSRLAAMLALSFFWLYALLHHESTTRKIGLSLVLAGGWNNLLEGWKKGYVTDYIRFPKAPGFLGRLVFNGSDFCIAAGGFLTVIGR